MKTSGKLMLILGGFVLVLIILSAVFVRSSVRKVLSINKTDISGEMNTDRKAENFAVENFDTIKLSGLWAVNITRGEEYSVKIDAPAYIFDKISVNNSGRILEIQMEKSTVFGFSNNEIRLDVTCPALKKLSADGASAITVKGFDEASMEVDLGGTVSVKGESNSLGRLVLNADGAFSFDFSKSQAVNASVFIDGAGSVKLTMNGGVLDGEINGIGSLEYYGPVSGENVRKNGLASVKHK
ncbi:MAG: hypothetical protein E4H36_01615 [Spirochaetales bacterium]|nr:MAG: hypothetical protein E4H36_01615 [Spirochaetales bacterium]